MVSHDGTTVQHPAQGGALTGSGTIYLMPPGISNGALQPAKVVVTATTALTAGTVNISVDGTNILKTDAIDFANTNVPSNSTVVFDLTPDKFAGGKIPRISPKSLLKIVYSAVTGNGYIGVVFS